MTMLAAASATVLRVFFSVLLLLVLARGFYMLNRKKFFAHTGDASDSYASANLRMWLVILVWIPCCDHHRADDLRSLTTRITYYPGHAPPAPSGTVSSARSCTSRYLRSE